MCLEISTKNLALGILLNLTRSPIFMPETFWFHRTSSLSDAPIQASDQHQNATGAFAAAKIRPPVLVTWFLVHYC
jgi:hypothetical protein